MLKGAPIASAYYMRKDPFLVKTFKYEMVLELLKGSAVQWKEHAV